MSAETGTDDGGTITTVVDLPDNPEPVVDEPDTVNVVVENVTPPTTPDTVAPLLDHESRLLLMEQNLAAMSDVIAMQAVATANVAETAEVALELATEPEPEPEPDKTPEKKHFLHKSWGELLGRN